MKRFKTVIDHLVFSEVEGEADETAAALYCTQHGYRIIDTFRAEIGGEHIIAARESEPLEINRHWVKNGYAGGEWLARQQVSIRGKREPVKVSPFGMRVADLLGHVFAGLYHLDEPELRADWSRNNSIKFRMYLPMSTYDGDELTALVMLAHHMAIRIEIRPLSNRTISIVFSQRKTTGNSFDRHPSIEEAVEKFRSMCTVEPAAATEAPTDSIQVTNGSEQWTDAYP